MITFLKNNEGLVPCYQWESGCWVIVELPTKGDKDYLINELKIPSDFYNDIADMDERPRIEIEGGWCMIVIRIPVTLTYTKLPYSTVPLGIIFKDDICISISFHSTDMLPGFVKFTRHKGIDRKTNLELVLRLMLSSSVWFLKYLKQIDHKIKLAEDQLEKSIKNEDLHSLLRLSKCMVYFKTSIKGNDILIHKIKNLKEYKHEIDPELIEDVEIESQQALEMTNIYSDILSGTMDAYSSVISNNLNHIMKLLTSISIILMIPTLISSFYGMNVPNSLQMNSSGFHIIILISFLCAIVGLLFFKKKNWI